MSFKFTDMGFKFQVGEEVYVRPLNKLCWVQSARIVWNETVPIPKIEYEVWYEADYWDNYSCVAQYLGKKPVYVKVLESDLVSVYPKSVSQTNPGPFPFFPVDPGPAPTWKIDDLRPLEKINKNPKCECGKEKHGFATHSNWCDLYDKT